MTAFEFSSNMDYYEEHGGDIEEILGDWNDFAVDVLYDLCDPNGKDGFFASYGEKVAALVYPKEMPKWAMPYREMTDCYGYTWPGMIAVRPESLDDVMSGKYGNLTDTCIIYRLYPDGTESETDDFQTGTLDPSILYGVEAGSIQKYLEGRRKSCC